MAVLETHLSALTGWRPWTAPTGETLTRIQAARVGSKDLEPLRSVVNSDGALVTAYRPPKDGTRSSSRKAPSHPDLAPCQP